MSIFEEYAYYYDLLYNDKDYSKEAKYIDQLLKDEDKSIKYVLNLGCGTGNHDTELHKLGYSVHGIDMSESMIDEANKKKKEELSFEVSDIRNYKTNKKYDAVTSLFHVMSYQNSNEDLENTLKVAYDSLKDNGTFIFDCWYGPGVLADLPVVRVKEVENEKCKLIRIAKPEMFAAKNLVYVNYETIILDKSTGYNKILNETHKMRYLFTPEVEYMLNKVGFKKVKCYKYGSQKDPTYESWNAIFIANK